VASIQESAEGADVPSSNADFIVSVSESVTVSDAPSAGGDFVNSVSEAVLGTDEFSSTTDFIAQINESVTAADAFISRLLWETINTFEATNWQVIDNAQIVATSLQRGAFAENSFAGGPFAGGEIEYRIGQVLWTEVNTSQTTTWTVVETQT
jgi:hypothetical protein